MLQNFDMFQASSKDIPNERDYETNGIKYRLKRSDPYGFVSIHYPKGQMASELAGSYTSFDTAKKAIDAYLRNRK